MTFLSTIVQVFMRKLKALDKALRARLSGVEHVACVFFMAFTGNVRQQLASARLRRTVREGKAHGLCTPRVDNGSVTGTSHIDPRAN